MRIDPTTGRVTLGGVTRAFDTMIAAACAVSSSVLTGPIGGARLPEPEIDTLCPAMAITGPIADPEAYAIGYRIVASERGLTPKQAE